MCLEFSNAPPCRLSSCTLHPRARGVGTAERWREANEERGEEGVRVHAFPSTWFIDPSIDRRRSRRADRDSVRSVGKAACQCPIELSSQSDWAWFAGRPAADLWRTRRVDSSLILVAAVNEDWFKDLLPSDRTISVFKGDRLFETRRKRGRWLLYFPGCVRVIAVCSVIRVTFWIRYLAMQCHL